MEDFRENAAACAAPEPQGRLQRFSPQEWSHRGSQPSLSRSERGSLYGIQTACSSHHQQPFSWGLGGNLSAAGMTSQRGSRMGLRRLQVVWGPQRPGEEESVLFGYPGCLCVSTRAHRNVKTKEVNEQHYGGQMWRSSVWVNFLFAF